MQQNINRLLNYKTDEREKKYLETKRQLRRSSQYVNSTHQNSLFNYIQIIIHIKKIYTTVNFPIE